MRISATGLIVALALPWLTFQDPGQGPPRGQRPGAGAERGDQDPGGRPPRPEDFGPGEPPPPPPPHPIFLALDLDNDGELSSKEIAKAATSLAKLDRNKDGIISENEVRPLARPAVAEAPVVPVALLMAMALPVVDQAVPVEGLTPRRSSIP